MTRLLHAGLRRGTAGLLASLKLGVGSRVDRIAE